jgi:hypothetical protein
MIPLLPEVASPVEKEMAPLTPAVPAVLVKILIPPLVAAVLLPAVSVMAPPVAAVSLVVPAVMETAPPTPVSP